MDPELMKFDQIWWNRLCYSIEIWSEINQIWANRLCYSIEIRFEIDQNFINSASQTLRIPKMWVWEFGPRRCLGILGNSQNMTLGISAEAMSVWEFCVGVLGIWLRRFGNLEFWERLQKAGFLFDRSVMTCDSVCRELWRFCHARKIRESFVVIHKEQK